MDDPLRARFPDVPASAGHYESFYLRAAHPSQPLGVWIRHTVHKRPGAEPNGSLWFTLFDAAAGEPLARKVTLPRPTAGEAAGIEIGESSFGSATVRGQALDASWVLRFDEGAAPLLHLPREWMYGARIPRTKTLSPHPSALVSGTVRVGERRLELDRWPGMVGHNWGAEHAERWVWMHAIGFEDRRPDTWLDVAIGRVKLGPLTTPWIANGALALDGVRHRLGGIGRLRSTRVNESPTRCEFELQGSHALAIKGEVSADARHFVAWEYADPAGPGHNAVNCSIAAMTLTVSQPGKPDLTLHTSSGASYELGMRETDHGIPLQPYPDG